MDESKKSIIRVIFMVCLKIVLILVMIVTFYKLPSIIAEKISYIQLKNKEIKQDLAEEK
ncbi:MAG: hypothetical protein ACI4F4_07480 [Lachnospiraceae bacterium]